MAVRVALSTLSHDSESGDAVSADGRATAALAGS
jgi:hypothetical protein